MDRAGVWLRRGMLWDVGRCCYIYSIWEDRNGWIDGLMDAFAVTWNDLLSRIV